MKQYYKYFIIFFIFFIARANAQTSASEDFIYSPSPITSTQPFVNGTINLGHSIGAGYGLTGGINTSYPYYLDKYFGVSNSINYSVSGVGVRNQYLNFIAKNSAIPRLAPISVMLGINEIRNGVDTLHRFAHLKAGFRAIAAAQFTKSIQFYQTGTLPIQNTNITNSNNSNFFTPTIDTLADWGSRAYWYQKNDNTNSKMNFWIKNNITANETVTITNVMGSNIAIGTWGCDSSRTYLSRFSINIDGVYKGIYDPNQQTYSIGALVNPDFGLGGFGSNLRRLGLVNDAIIITGLTETLHTVVLTFLDAGKYGAWDYIAELKKPQDCQQLPIYFWDLGHCNNTGYNYQGYSFTQEMVDSASSSSFRNLKANFPNYPIFRVKTNQYFDPVNFPQMIQSDGLHPTTVGDSAMSLALIDLVNKNRNGSIYQWKTLSGIPNQLSITQGGLSYPGYKSSLSTNGNNKLSLVSGNTETINGFADLNKDGTVDKNDSLASKSVYYSFMMNMQSTDSLTNNNSAGDYFTAISNSIGDSNHAAMVFVRKGTNDGYQVGLKFNKDNANPVNWLSPIGDNMEIGLTYLITLRYSFNVSSAINDTIDMWINPILSGTIPMPLLTIKNVGNTIDLSKVGALIIRQGINISSLDLDGMLISDKWDSAQVLPVSLQSFSASYFLNNQVQLNWQILRELNLSSYFIQRSTNGSNFEDIGTIIAKGGGDYSYIDNQLTAATTFYYRLQIVDKDGSFTNSKVVAVNLNSKLQTINLYPNPVKESFFVQLAASKAETVTLQITDMQGRVLQQQVQPLTIGSNNLSINTSNLAKGTYVLVVKGQVVQQKQFVKE